MIDVKTLFNKTLNELDARINSGDEYSLLMTAGLLRKLLVDGENSLVHQIDKNRKKLSFHVNIRQPLHRRVPTVFTENDLLTYSWLAESGFNPDTANTKRDYNPQHIGLDKFLGQVVIYTKGQEITVRDLIKHISDKEGAVHKQRKPLSSDEIKNILLRELGNYLSIYNIPAGLSTLKTISIIVKRDLSKLQD